MFTRWSSHKDPIPWPPLRWAPIAEGRGTFGSQEESFPRSSRSIGLELQCCQGYLCAFHQEDRPGYQGRCGRAMCDGLSSQGPLALQGPPRLEGTGFRKLTLSSFCFRVSALLVPMDVEGVGAEGVPMQLIGNVKFWSVTRSAVICRM